MSLRVDSVAGSQHAVGGSRRWKVLAVTAASGFMVYLDVTVLNIAFPSIHRAFAGTSLAGLSWVLSAYSIVFAALLVPSGRLADEFGRRRLFLAGVALFTAASAACAASPSAGFLIAARVVQAVGGAVLVPTSQALLMSEFAVNKRSLAVGLWGAAAGLAGAAGPPLGGVVVDGLSWRWVFLLNVPIGCLALLAGRRLLLEQRDPDNGLPDFAGTALIVAAIGALALAIVQGGTWGWADWRIVASFVAFVVLLPLFVWRSARHPRPVVETGLFRLRSVSIANLGTLLVGIAFFASLLASVLFLTGVWRYSPLRAGLALTPAPIAGALVAGPAGRLADRFGHRVMAVPGAVVLAGAGIWYRLRLGTEPDFVGDWLPGSLMVGVGLGLAYSTLTSAAVTDLSGPQFGIGSAINAMTRQLGAVLGVALVIAVIGTPRAFDVLPAFDRAWLLMAILALCGAAACAALDRTGTASVDEH